MRDPRFDDDAPWAHRREATADELERARALAREVAASPAGHIERLAEIGETFRAWPDDCWRVFHDERAAAIRAEMPRRQAWSDALAEDARAEMRSILPSSEGPGTPEEQALLHLSEQWRRERDPFSVWGHPSSHSGHESLFLERSERLLSRLNLLLRVDPARALRLCDALPFPGMMEAVFYWGYYVREDRELIEDLLASAPLVFDDCGAWKPERSVAALLLTALVVKHAERLHLAALGRVRGLKAPAAGPDAPIAAAERALEEMETTELPAWMRRTFDILLQRPDGRTIGFGYLADLLKHRFGGRYQASGPKTEWSALDHATEALAQSLTAAGATTVDAMAAWHRVEEVAKEQLRLSAARTVVRPVMPRGRGDRRGEGARVLHGHGMSYLLSALQMSGAEPRALWSWFEEILVGRDPSLSLAEYGDASPIALRLGALLANLLDFGKVFRQTYRRLEPQRRRVLHPSVYGYSDHDRESLFLLRVGLHAVEIVCERSRRAPAAEAAQNLFFDIYACVRRLWLTDPRSHSNAKKNLVPVCFAFMPAVFGDTIGAALVKTVPPIANSPRMLAEACWFLWKNGVEPACLIREAGGDLDGALRDLKQWSELVDDRRRDLEFPAHLRELAGAVGISFPKEQAAPESERVAQRSVARIS